MTIYVWPTRWLAPARFPRPQLATRSQSGGVSTSGVKVSSRTDGGGFWKLSFNGVMLHTPQLLRAYGAWCAILDDGGAKVIVPKSMGALTPNLGGAAPEPAAADPFPHLVADYVPPVGVVASLQGAALLRATSIVIRTTQASSIGLTGGERFAINHATKGWRSYDIGEVTAIAAPAGGHVDHTCSIRPPLREATAGGTAIDFNAPACVCAIDSMTPPEELRFGSTDIVFSEDFS